MLCGHEAFILERLVKGGMTVQSLKYDEFEHQAFPLPPLAEQKRIVAKVEELLAFCDELEAAQTAAREHRTRLVRSALDHLTTAQTEPEFRQHAAFVLQHSDLVLDSVFDLRKAILQLAIQGHIKTQPGEGAFPQVRLASLGDWALGCGFPTAEQGHTDRPILFSKVSDMNLDGNELEIHRTNHTIDEATAKRLRVKVHPPGTVIFPKIGGAIATNKRRIIVKPTAIDNNCLGIIPNKSCSTAWLFLVLSAIDLAKYQSGTSVPALNQGTIGEIGVSLPPLAEQQRIVAKVDELMRWCDALEARLTAAQTTATTLLDATLHQILTT